MNHKSKSFLLLFMGIVMCVHNSIKADVLTQDLRVGDITVLRTVYTPFDPENAEETYKVYTHVLDFAGEAPITKGVGGRFTHHRGLYIGWSKTWVDDERSYDTWHMPNCYQQHVQWLHLEMGEGHSTQKQEIVWNTREDETLIRETREIVAHIAPDGKRIIRFGSKLVAVAGDIQLRGDSHHAGMQIRMSNEVAENPETTEYILPEGAELLPNDEVSGAWWVCAAVDVGGKRYWVVHMTPKDHPGGEPLYSIRDYARFGAFTEPDIAKGDTLEVDYVIVVSEEPLDTTACQALYDAYTGLR